MALTPPLHRLAAIVVSAGLSIGSLPASAENPVAPGAPAASPVEGDEANRFEMKSGPDGTYLRLDRKTGQVATCRYDAGGFACRLAADDREALLTEIDRLNGERAEMKGKVDELTGEVASLKRQFDDLRKGKGSAYLSDDDIARIDRVFGFVEETMKRVDDLARDLKDRWNR